MTTVEFEDVSDLHTMIDAAKPMLSLPAEATAEEVYINGFEVVLQQITKSFSSNATKAEYLRLAVLRDIDFKTGETEEMYNLAHRVGASYLMHGKIKDAEETLLYALGGLNKIHGDQEKNVHPEVLKVCGTLTTVYERSGEYKKAIAMASRVLKAQEEQLGNLHRTTLLTITNVAGLLQHVEDTSQSEDMYKRALIGLETVIKSEAEEKRSKKNESEGSGGGNDDSSVTVDLDLDYLTCMGNYAILLEKKKDEDSVSLALTYYKRALRGKEILLGKNDPDTLRSLSNLGNKNLCCLSSS
jgi:tetratricopeptide (TPR) repeat protein